MKKSFGLIEVLISVGILAMFLGALLALSASGTKLTLSAERRVQAANLAREGMEIVRQIKSTAWLKGDDVFDDVEDPCYKLKTPSPTKYKRPLFDNSCDNYRLDDVAVGKIEVINSSGESLGEQNDNQAGIGNNYGRGIEVQGISSNVKRIVVEVKWYEGNYEKKLKMVSYLTNWQ